MPMLSRRDLEKISRKFLLPYLRLYDSPLECIDPTDFAEKMCGIRFEFTDTTDIRFTRPLLGITSPGKVEVNFHNKDHSVHAIQLDGKTAFIDQKLAEEGNTGRLNFTKMHEVAHQLLIFMYPEEYDFKRQPVLCRFADERCSRPITDWPEWQTNVLASCLLLPRELVLKQMQQFGLGDKIRMLNRVFAAREYEQFSQMADALGVSKTALSIRMVQLGLIGRNDFYDPYALVNVYKEDGEVA